MRTVVFGIKNCDTMKKTFAWLDSHGLAYQFHDYRKSGIDAPTLQRWCDAVGYDALINRRGTTWRKLSPDQQGIDSDTAAIALMQAHPSLIRRPVIEHSAGALIIGFNADTLAAGLSPARPATEGQP
jgi:arsenate reductase (glutaredoxin)